MKSIKFRKFAKVSSATISILNAILLLKTIKWAANGFKQEKQMMGRINEKILASSEAVPQYSSGNYFLW